MIEIRINGSQSVTKLEAARALNEVDSGVHVCIGEPNDRGRVEEDIYLRARHHAYGEVQPPGLGCMSFHAETAGEMRRQAEAIALAAEIRDLADMLAAGQGTAVRTVDLSKCLGKYDHLGNTDYCQRDEGHDGQHAGHMGRRWSAEPRRRR
jgi:hypothetical protein